MRTILGVSLAFVCIASLADSVPTVSPLSLPLKPDKTIAFKTDQATWLSLDVAPLGETFVIEVLGDLYTLPIAGGEAKPLLLGTSFDSQPRFSPDGSKIAFISDRDGSEEVWFVEVDSKKLTKLSTTPDVTEFASPTWAPDGSHVLVSRSSWELRTFELWAYPLQGGSGVQITQSKASSSTPVRNRHSALGPDYDPSGRYLYYARKLGGFAYNTKFPMWQIARRDLYNGVEDIITSARGSGIRPKLSPDGQWLVYATRHKQKTGLRIRELASGRDEWLAYPVQRDEQETRFTRDTFPGYAFAADGHSVYTTRDGKILRIDLRDKTQHVVPFSIDVEKEVNTRLHFPYRIGLGPIKARVLAHPQLSPDGRKLAFTAFSRVYIYDLKKQTVVAISPKELSAAMPSWSPSGKLLVYVTWSQGQGHIYRQRARAGAKARRITQQAAFYSHPTWSPHDDRIVALRGSAQEHQAREGGWGQVVGADVIWLPSKGGDAHVVIPSRGLSRPHFGAEQDRIYLHASTSPLPSKLKSGLVSVRYDGTDRRAVFNVTGRGIYSVGDKANPEFMQRSADGKHVLIQHAQQLYVAKPVPYLASQKIELSKPTLPLLKITDVGADFASWSADGQEIIWTVGDQFYKRAVASLVFEPISDDSKDVDDNNNNNNNNDDDVELTLAESHAAVQKRQVDIYLPRSKPAGTIAITHATILTMGKQGVIEDGVVVISGDRIEAIGPAASIDIPSSAKQINARGMYVLPGFIDTHAHYRVSDEIPDPAPWSFLTNMAYGVTTGMDVQPTTIALLAAKDRVDAGLSIGPRAFSTGPGIFSNNDFKSQSHATAVLQRYRDHYQVHNLKAYILGSRKQRQWFIQAARELQLMPTTEGALDMKLGLTHIVDGFSGLEHALPLPKLYADVVTLTAKSSTAYTPTLLVSYGGPQGENYFYTHHNPYGDKKLQRFMPGAYIDSRVLRRSWFHDAEYVTDSVARSALDIVAAGGQVGVGAHGQLQGLGYHWELWSLVQGGFDELQALRSATIMGAQMLGIEQDVGSLEVGKLADLILLSEDPRLDIQHTTKIHQVMKGGVLYDSNTLDEVWPRSKPLPAQWWWRTHPTELNSKEVP